MSVLDAALKLEAEGVYGSLGKLSTFLLCLELYSYGLKIHAFILRMIGVLLILLSIFILGCRK